MSRPESRRIPAATPAKGATRRLPAAAPPKNPMILVGAFGGGVVLLLLVIAAAASGGGGGKPRPGPKRSVEVAAPAAPVEKPRPVNFVRNTGAIVFVCGGTEKHKDLEVVLSRCPKCPAKKVFTVDADAQGYRCNACKAVYENAEIKCDQCGRPARVTHLKKIAGGS
jgi:hypothetical protein